VAVCEPLGCSIAVCTDKACARANRCPRTEDGRCADGFDNDTDGIVDCDDPDCDGADACVGGPLPTTPPNNTPAGTPMGTSMPNPTTPPAGPTPTPNPDQDCCIGHDEGSGCDVLGCESCVCDLDDFCCEEVWDTNCAGLANTDCIDLCQCGIATSPTPTTPTPSGSPGPASNCCNGRDSEDGPGCSLPVCEDCVCGVDDFCCADFWDESCADIAGSVCLAGCACDSAPPLPNTPTRTRTTAPNRTTPPPPNTPLPDCATSDDCPSGLICTSSRRCVAPSPTRGDDGDGNGGGGGGGGCALQPPATETGASTWLIVPGLLWAIGGRRRRARTKRPMNDGRPAARSRCGGWRTVRRRVIMVGEGAI
jgi:hypothetical protein